MRDPARQGRDRQHDPCHRRGQRCACDQRAGEPGGDTIIGNEKDNVLTGTSLADTIDGKCADDTIKGGGGADTIIGGRGADVLKGGDGPDVFVFGPGDMPKITDLSRLFSPLNTPHDSIADFTPGIDTIDLSAIDANTHRNGNQKFHFEGIGPAHRGQGDTDGDGAYDVLIVLKGHHHLHAGRLHPLTLAGYGRRSPCARALDYTDWSAASDPRRRRRRSDQSRHERASPCAEESLK